MPDKTNFTVYKSFGATYAKQCCHRSGNI